jgi:hypothetical protein
VLDETRQLKEGVSGLKDCLEELVALQRERLEIERERWISEQNNNALGAINKYDQAVIIFVCCTPLYFSFQLPVKLNCLLCTTQVCIHSFLNSGWNNFKQASF